MSDAQRATVEMMVFLERVEIFFRDVSTLSKSMRAALRQDFEVEMSDASVAGVLAQKTSLTLSRICRKGLHHMTPS